MNFYLQRDMNILVSDYIIMDQSKVLTVYVIYYDTILTEQLK